MGLGNSACNGAPDAPTTINPPARLVASSRALRRATLGNESRYVLRPELRSVPARVGAEGAQLRVAFGAPATAFAGRGKRHGPDRNASTGIVVSVAWRAGGRRVPLFQRRLSSSDADRWHTATIDLGGEVRGRGTIKLSAAAAGGARGKARDVYWAVPRLIPSSTLARTGESPRFAAPNLVVLSIDTLRADRLGCYGHERDTSPHIDRFASEGVLFKRAIATSSWTLPSHASMLTGLTVSRHGAYLYGAGSRLPARVDTLAELLWRRGYRTAGITGGGFLNFGLQQGFDRYWTVESVDALVQQARDWLREPRVRPFLLFLHTYAVHAPYTPPPPYNARFDPGYEGPFELAFTADDLRDIDPGSLDDRTIAHLSALYDGGIAYLDEQLGPLFDELARPALREDTCVVLTSDHGEEFGEHGDLFHDQAKLFAELLRVPLIVWCPSRYPDGRVVEAPVSLVDLTPTLLDLAGVRPTRNLDGVSLRPVLERGAAPRRSRLLLSEVHGSLVQKRGSVRAVRDDRHKLIVSTVDGSLALFDLARDPGETTDVSMAHPDVVERLASKLPASGQVQSGREHRIRSRPDTETLEQLRALGYLQDAEPPS